MTRDYHGPCLILLDRSTTVEVRRGGRVESVSMPTIDTTNKETDTTNKAT